ncbi:hypothetical protein [Myxococcus stipitatus]|uniref:hypothetical protein n=1 Tax=Myxococcus stipitatus TaxID=83455 RepID=UPI0030CD13E3
MVKLMHRRGATPDDEQLVLVRGREWGPPLGALLMSGVLAFLMLRMSAWVWTQGGGSWLVLPVIALLVLGIVGFLRHPLRGGWPRPWFLTFSRGRFESRRGDEVEVWNSPVVHSLEVCCRSGGTSRARRGYLVEMVLRTDGSEASTAREVRWPLDEVPAWDEAAARRYETIQRALSRFGLLAPSLSLPRTFAPEVAPPQLEVPESELEPALRALLQGRKGLPRGSRFLPSLDGSNLFIVGVLLLVMTPCLAAVAKGWVDAIRAKGDVTPWFWSGLGAWGVGLVLLVAWDIRRGRHDWAKVLEGSWRWGLYILPEAWVRVRRPNLVSVIPRARMTRRHPTRHRALVPASRQEATSPHRRESQFHRGVRGGWERMMSS